MSSTGHIPSLEELANRTAIVDVLTKHCRGVDRADGELRRGSRLSHGPRLRGRKDTDHLHEEFPLGARFTAFVDPRNPERSVVYRKPHYGLPAAAAGLHAALLAAAVAALRRRAAPAAPR